MLNLPSKWSFPTVVQHIKHIQIKVTCDSIILLCSTPAPLVTTPEKAFCRCNGNPMLSELSINLLQTTGPVRSLKIEDIHWGSLRLGSGLGPYIHCSVRRTKCSNESGSEVNEQVAFSLKCPFFPGLTANMPHNLQVFTSCELLANRAGGDWKGAPDPHMFDPSNEVLRNIWRGWKPTVAFHCLADRGLLILLCYRHSHLSFLLPRQDMASLMCQLL